LVSKNIKKLSWAKSTQLKAFTIMMYHNHHHPLTLTVIANINLRTASKWANKKFKRTGTKINNGKKEPLYKIKDPPVILLKKEGTALLYADAMAKGDRIYITSEQGNFPDTIIVECPDEEKRLNEGFKKIDIDKEIKQSKQQEEKFMIIKKLLKITKGCKN